MAVIKRVGAMAVVVVTAASYVSSAAGGNTRIGSSRPASVELAAASADAEFYGSAGATHLNSPIVALSPTPDGGGYWLTASDGGIFTYGDARFYGSAGSLGLNRPIVAMAATPDGGGYWLVASDGGIFTYGDAHFYGSTGALRLNSPIVAMSPTPDGGGYWLTASDGGIFTYGDATYHGSAGNTHLNSPIVAIAPTPTGGGYWLTASDGGIFTYGDATYYGSTGGMRLQQPVRGMATSRSVNGYWLVAADGGVFPFNPTSAPPGAGNTEHFPTSAVGAALPSDSTCASAVRPAPEVRPSNAVANSTRGVGGNSLYPRVTGDYAGTTDEIIQWTACKWGIDEDVVRAQAVVESYWFQGASGDFTTDAAQCVPGHQTLGADGVAGECPESIGILQVRYPYHQTAFQTDDDAAVSTAYNLDYAYANWRNCYEGNDGWLNQFNPPQPYQAGDLWGCIGVWYSGRWYDSDAVSYVAKVQDALAQRTWTTSPFLSDT